MRDDFSKDFYIIRYDSNKIIGNENQMTSNSRVGDTLNSLGQGMLHLSKGNNGLLFNIFLMSEQV